MSTRAIWLVANWKMNGSKDLAQQFCHRVNAALAGVPASVNAVLCPPFPLLPDAVLALPGNARLQLGAQNCHAEKEGAFTGEVSATQVKEAGCRYVILGHSERRAQFGESDALVLKKAQAALVQGLIPIICVGEQEEDYKKGRTAEVLKTQTAGLTKLAVGSYLVAYEPVWAIGSGKTPSGPEISAAHRQIKSALGSETSVLYGGSVKSTNLREILGVSEVAGALIGGASLEPEGMKTMIEIAAEQV